MDKRPVNLALNFELELEALEFWTWSFSFSLELNVNPELNLNSMPDSSNHFPSFTELVQISLHLQCWWTKALPMNLSQNILYGSSGHPSEKATLMKKKLSEVLSEVWWYHLNHEAHCCLFSSFDCSLLCLLWVFLLCFVYFCLGCLYLFIYLFIYLFFCFGGKYLFLYLWQTFYILFLS